MAASALARPVAEAQPRRPPAIPARRLLLGALGALTLAQLAWVALAPMSALVARSTDDAFYYFSVARNVVTGHGWTFDGINPTNGFHPLWMACLIPVFALFRGEAEPALRGALALTAVVGGAAVWMAFLAVSRQRGTGTALGVAALLTVPPFASALTCGLETGLLLLLLFMLIAAEDRFQLLALDASPARNLALGVLLGAVFLCRLDAVFVVAAVGAAAVWPRSADGAVRLVPALRKARQVALPLAAIAGVYLAWNAATFGHLVPISGAVKSSFPRPSFALARLLHPHVAFGWMQLAVAAGATLATRRLAPGLAHATRRPSLWAALWCGSLAHLAYSLAFMNWAVHWWHFAAYLPVTTAALAGAVAAWARGREWSRRGRVLAVAVLATVWALGWAGEAALRGKRHLTWYEAARWARRSLPPDAVVALRDAGVFGYFAGRPTVNLDGVINGYAYQAALRDGRLAAYLRERGVTHVADADVAYTGGAYAIRLPARLWRRPGAVVLASEGGEVYRSPAYADPLHQKTSVHFAMWPLSALRIAEGGAAAARR
jgi:hypothetical protein